MLLKHWNLWQLSEISVAVVLASVTDLPTAIGALLTLVIVDILTGVAAAYRRGEVIRSRRYFDGLVQKLLSIALIVPLWLFERYFGDNAYPFSTWAGYVVAFGELISIIENCDALGVPVAGKLLNKLKEKDHDGLSDHE
jgi:toxin secretion/phage lysis holin